MAFVARKKDHAIVEVVFGFQLSRPWHDTEIEKLVRGHDRWKDKLPRLTQTQTIFGDVVPQPVTLSPVLGVSFERIKPDGEPAWRLRCEGHSLFVNCLEYTRWKDVWDTASGYMRGVFEAVGAEDMSVEGVFLQYINVFDWVACPKEYDIIQLLDVDSEYFPGAIKNYDAAWHLHQGSFVPVSFPMFGNILQKIHFDALREDKAGQPAIRLDTFLRFDFNDCVSAGVFLEENSQLEEVFGDLHRRNKRLLQNLLTGSVCKNIGLGKGV